MINLYLYGHLREQFAEHYTLAAGSPREAIRALCTMIPTFTAELKKANYNIIVGEDETAIDLGEDELDLRTNRNVHLMPVIEGENNGVLKIVLAIALVAVQFIPGVGQVIGAAGVTALDSTAASLFLAGIAALISPQSKSSNSFVFNGEQVTITQGSAIPLVYGKIQVNLQPISAAITNEATQGVLTENPTYGGPDGWTQIDNGTANPYNQPSYS